ncbi:Phage integrase family protein [Duganella sacchari]|uniref:Phage integrase family protein n=1 Tax=Duganella sacchari TaxID=551987 RepID=A0A1M7M829_9BURK|nr:site-specific integrase [Duganella sacchari]SHM86839.1 Phage integrase family protein [Duganella sacchari]
MESKENAVDQFIFDRATQSLPKIAKTRSGIEFDPNTSLWAFRDGSSNISVNFQLLPDVALTVLIGLKKTLIWYFENRAAETAIRHFEGFLAITRFLTANRPPPIRCVMRDDISDFKMSSDKAAYLLSVNRGFLKRWCKLGAPGLDKEIESYLTGLTLKQSPVGVAVATLDPNNGPLTDLEFEAIQSALNAAYARNKISTEKILLCYLLMSLGVRPTQLASLKCCDLILPLTADGDYILRVPRAKQSGHLYRGEFKERKLVVQLGKPLAAYVDTIRIKFVGLLADPAQAPLFPQWKHLESANCEGLEFHQTSSVLSQRVMTVINSLRVPSERLDGKPMTVSPLRFRRTFATRAAEEGWPILVLAELMDHSDTRHVKVYVGLTTRIRAAFSRKIAMDMAPLAMAFGGKIIDGENGATRPGPASRIIDLRVDQSGQSMGSCGSHAHCGFARPIACYGGCHDFEPWLNGPHEVALQYMLARREHLMATADPRIAAINDRAILGCAQVILRCRQIMDGAGE